MLGSLARGVGSQWSTRFKGCIGHIYADEFPGIMQTFWWQPLSIIASFYWLELEVVLNLAAIVSISTTLWYNMWSEIVNLIYYFKLNFNGTLL